MQELKVNTSSLLDFSNLASIGISSEDNDIVLTDEEWIDTETMTLMILFVGQRLVILHVFHLVWYIQPKGTKHTINKVSNLFFMPSYKINKKVFLIALSFFVKRRKKKKYL